MQRLALPGIIALAACATVPPASAGPIAGLGQTASIGATRIRPLAVVEDSRCPIDVVCVWAGQLVLLAEIDFQGGGQSFRGNITLGKPLPLGRETVTLVAAEPAQRAAVKTDPRAYRFTFSLEPRP